jgi:energy-coupling factor transporter ATP-binding protein EcfA2
LKTVEAQLSQIIKSKSKEENILLSLESDFMYLEKQCCHTCKQKIQSDTHDELVKDISSKIDASYKELESLQESVRLLSEKKQEILAKEIIIPKARTYKTIDEVHRHKNKLSVLESSINQKKSEMDPYQEQIDNMSSAAIEEIDKSDLNAISKVIEHQEFLIRLLINKDSFIRKKIIDQNLNYLNSRLGYYLTTLGLPHEVVFQNDLSVNITELGRELSFGNLSRGEAGRVCIGLSLAFRDVYERLYQKINLIFIDEVLDNGLDLSGTEAAMKLFQKMSRDFGNSVWLISHKSEMRDKCDVICKVVKENGFTEFFVDEPYD